MNSDASIHCHTRELIFHLQIVKYSSLRTLFRWIERQVQLLFSEHWCAFYLSELRQLLWPDGKLLSASDVVRTEAEKAATKEEALESFVDLMPGIR